MKRIYHHYMAWECFKSGMWRKVEKDKEQELIELAVEFTGNHIEYGAAMLKVVSLWKFSCEHNLSNKNINRRAWIGHAACSLRHNLPEYIVRIAWGLLSDSQRYLANLEADKAILTYEVKKTIPNNQLSLW